MTKVTLDKETFKALASDTRLDILRVLDGKKMSLKDISKATSLNKATLHEHLIKLHEAGLVKKKEREGHKWVYYKLSWKGESLLHPENTKIVVMFCVTFFSLLLAVMLIASFVQPIIIGMAETQGDTIILYEAEEEGIPLLSERTNYNYLTEIDAKEQTVDNVTLGLLTSTKPKNYMGEEYGQCDIKWVTPGNAVLKADQSIVLYSYSHPLNKSYNGSTNWTINGNDTNISEMSHDGYGGGFDNNEDRYISSPIVTEMIATVQDPTFLYLAIVCISIFTVLLPTSSWKLWKNKKPKL